MKSILNIDPKKRITIEEMKTHPWFNIFRRDCKIPSGIIVGYNRIPVKTIKFILYQRLKMLS
jgi:5'-AMP-activated protein kinase catalytic alpha subunit